MNFDKQHLFGFPEVVFLEEEFDRLFDLICVSSRATPGIALLWQKLQRAERVGADDAPEDLARLGSLVSFTDLISGRRQTAQLITPGANAKLGRVSVTTIGGAALIGLRPGDSFSWSLADAGSGALRIDNVTEDPRRPRRLAEAGAAAHLERARELLSLS